MLFSRQKKTTDTVTAEKGEATEPSTLLEVWRTLPAFMQALAVLLPVVVAAYLAIWSAVKPPPDPRVAAPSIDTPPVAAPSVDTPLAASARTSIATLGFVGGTVESVKKVFHSGTTQRLGDGFVLQTDVNYVGYPMTAWTYFSPKNKATSVVAMLKTTQRTKSGDYGNSQNGYVGDIYTYCKTAFVAMTSQISNQFGNPVSPVLDAQKVDMNADESAVMVGGTGGSCQVPGNTCSMGGWKASARADFNADSGPVSLSMNTRAAENSTFVLNKTSNNTGGLCEIRLDGSF